MTDTPKKERKSFIKLIALTAFILIIVLISWVSIKLVNVMPEAFSSLASLAESVRDKQIPDTEEELINISVASSEAVINSGDSVNLNWQTTNAPGTFTFSYDCDSGVEMSLVASEAESKELICGNNYNVGKVETIELEVNSEHVRFVDINYSIAFLGTEDTTPIAVGKSSLMVVNNTIPDESAETDDDTVDEEVATNTTSTEESESELTTEETPTYQQEFTYQIPASDPNGRTDLSTSFIASGNIVGQTFIPGLVIAEDGGAIQFEVKNYGTKTSEEWTFSVTLPNGGEYESTDQDPLKPNERAVLTVGFSGSEQSRHEFVVEIDSDTDRNSFNDKFTEIVNLY